MVYRGAPLPVCSLKFDSTIQMNENKRFRESYTDSESAGASETPFVTCVSLLN